MKGEKNMKIAVIGCTHAGTAAVVNATKLYPNAEINVYERNDTVSFLSCGIALHVSGVVEDAQGLFYSSPEELQKLGAKTYMQHDVTDVNLEEKTLRVKNLQTNEEQTDTFDKLIITTGSWPIKPNIKNIDMQNIILCKNYNHAKTIIEKVEEVQNIVVAGAGYIGVELVEAFEEHNKNVTLIDMSERILSKYLDKDFTQVAEKAMTDHNIKLALGEKITKFEGENGKVNQVITDKNSYKTDLVVLCIGFQPNTGLFKDKLEMTKEGAIVINEYMETSQKNVFAAGDSCSVIYNPTKDFRYIPLATNAVRMGTLAAMNLEGQKVRYMGTQGTSGIKIYNHNIASTGLTEAQAMTEGFDVKTVTVTDNFRPEFMPSNQELTMKLVYDKKTEIILGAQLISDDDFTPLINTLSVVIQNQMTVKELAFVDFFFQPHFNKPWNILNSLAMKAL